MGSSKRWWIPEIHCRFLKSGADFRGGCFDRLVPRNALDRGDNPPTTLRTPVRGRPPDSPVLAPNARGYSGGMKRLRIRINLALLRANVSEADARAWSEAEVLQWLQDAGFTADGDWWIAGESDLGQLDPAEVTAVEDVPD